MKILYILSAALASLLPTAFAATGDTQCVRGLCISAINHNNATTTYDLTVTAPQIGWMAMGFGRSMIQAPMVILWRDSTNGKTIVSHRSARSFVMPTVVENPNPVATPLDFRTVSNSGSLTLSFSVPSTTETRQTVIWAWSSNAPSSNAVDATIVQHDDQGQIQLNMINQLPDSVDGTTPTTSVRPTSTGFANADSGPLNPTQKVFAAHGIILSLAFLVILPIGALQARFLRSYVPGRWWFAAHWILQWPITGILIIVGFSIATAEVKKVGTGHLNTTHKKWGLAIICMYIFQCCLGGFIHFIKDARASSRPPQNYAHAVVGLLIIALSFWQVYTGLDVEWPQLGGTVSTSIWTWWKVWIVMMPVLYAAGLAFLPRQYRMEASARKERTSPVRISAPKERRYSYSA